MIKFWIACWFAMARLPLPIFRLTACLIASFFTVMLFIFGRDRRQVTLTNLRLCFPKASGVKRLQWCVQHMYFYLRTFLDRAWLWNGSRKQLLSRVHLVNPEALQQLELNKATILLAPHFLGLDAAWSRLSASLDMVTMYSNQKNLFLNEVIRKGRERFGNQQLLSRQQGIRPVIQAMKAGCPLYYLPDMDFGGRDSVFVTFFGVPAATVTAVSRVARLLDAQVIPVITEFRHGQYFVQLLPPLVDFPVKDDVESAQAMNHHIERWVEANTPQYLWLHKRFKTRPAGQAKLY